MKKVVWLLALAVCLIFLSGCSTYNQQSAALANAWDAGNADAAVAAVSLKAEKSTGDKDELLWRLEQGAVLSAVGNIEGSQQAFGRAEELVDRYEEEAKVSMSKEALALLSNQANLPYRGRAYDKIMLNTYKALNCLLVKDQDGARVELNRAMQRQKDAVEENRKKIEKSIEASEEMAQANPAVSQPVAGQQDAGGYDVERAKQDPVFSGAVDAEMAEVNQRLLAYTDYVNPFAVFLDALFFSRNAFDNSDMERARKSFERVLEMSPGSYIAADYAASEAMADGAAAQPTTYILFATGRAPTRDQVRIDIPLFLLTDEVSYIGAAFPKLRYHDNYIPQISAVGTDGTPYVSERLCSMDAVVGRSFKNEWPVIMTKVLATTATKALAARAAEEVVKQNGGYLAQLAAKAATVSYQAASNIADLRTWITLPKEFAYIRMPTPVDGKLTLRVGANEQSVEVAPGATHVIMVRSISDLALPILTRFSFNQE